MACSVERHLAHLVEEERAAVRRSKRPGLLLVGAGEGPALVAEQLALDQLLGERGAVERHVGPLGPGARMVDRAGDELFAGAALAGDEDRGLCRCHLGRAVQSLPKDRGAAEDLVEPMPIP